MVKKSAFFIFLFFISLLGLQGCETVKGAGQGFKKDVQNALYQLTDQDSELKKADAWVQENLW